jgi:major intrinsic protein
MPRPPAAGFSPFIDGDAMRRALQQHWPEFLIEAWALGTFMVAAALFTALVEYPGSPVHPLLVSGAARRALLGLAMGLTAVALIYSAWGQRSGAHLNPAITLTFLRLRKIRPWDAVFYIAGVIVRIYPRVRPIERTPRRAIRAAKIDNHNTSHHNGTK